MLTPLRPGDQVDHTHRPGLASPTTPSQTQPRTAPDGRVAATGGRRQTPHVEELAAPIVSFEEFNARRPAGRIVATSGGFDPIHPGHISSLQESRRYGDIVVVIVNGDTFLTSKKGKPFQDLDTRCRIVSAIKGVDFVVPFEIEGDTTVREALGRLHPDVFTKGGDRVDNSSIPEWDVCEKLGIEVVSGVGYDKQWSSSWFLEDWSRHAAGR